MPSNKLTKTEFREHYNIVEVFNDKTSIMEKLKSFNSKNQAIALGVKKTPRDTMPEWFKVWFQEFDDKLNTRLDKYDQMFKEHGWIK